MSRRRARRAAAAKKSEAAPPAAPTATTAASPSAPETTATATATPSTLVSAKFSKYNNETDLKIAFKGVDASLQDYYQGLRQELVNQISSGETTVSEAGETFSQLVSEVLVDSGVCSDLAIASSLAKSLLQPTQQSQATTTKSEAASSDSIGTASNAYTGIAQSSTKRTRGRKTKQQVWLEEKQAKEDQDVAKAKRQADLLNIKMEKKKARKKKFKETNAEQAEKERQLIENELKEAREASIHARTAMGAFKGSLETKEFTLPNPGGGQPLLEDVSTLLFSVSDVITPSTKENTNKQQRCKIYLVQRTTYQT